MSATPQVTSTNQPPPSEPGPAEASIASATAETSAAGVQDARKRWLALIAIGSAIGCYAIWNVVFLSVSGFAERQLGSVPFRDEGWLRYLLPAYMGQADAHAIFVTGSSAARENLLIYKFEESFPDSKIVLGACSVATMEDTILGLEYIERVYGEEHIPGTIVLGITSRTVGCFNNGHSPLQTWTFDRYSPYLKVKRTADDFAFEDKSLWASVQGSWGLLLKQPTRYKTSIVAVGANLLFGRPDTETLFEHVEDMKKLDPVVDKLGWAKTLHLWTQLYVLPYKYHHQPPRTQATLDRWLYEDDTSYWHRARAWDASQDRERVTRLFDRFFAFTRRHNCRVFIVNLPEHPQAMREYKGDRYAKYLDVVRSAIGDTPFLDMHDQFRGDQFHDFIHLKAAGAKQLSDRVLAFMADEAGK